MTGASGKTALVTGASGFVGSHIVRALVERGRKVRVLVRRTSKLEAIYGLPVDICFGDVLEPDTIRRAMNGCGSVFYSVVDPRFWLSDTAPLRRNNVDGLVNAMDIALECGIDRFIFTSTMGTLGINPDGPVTEDTPFNWLDRAPAYIRVRLEAEQRLLTYARDRDLPAIALCVANTYGPHDYQPTPHNGSLWHTASSKGAVAMGASQPTVDIRDVAEAALLAEQHGRIGERYIIANEFVSNRQFFTMAAAHLGNPPPRIVPMWLAHGVARVSELVCKLLGKRDYMVSTDAVYLSNVFGVLDNRKARRELHWNPRPLGQTVADALDWFAQHQPPAS